MENNSVSLQFGTILILEDDPGIGELQKRTLERAGHAVTLSARPEDALQKIVANHFDMIVLDYRLNGPLTGVEFYQALRARGLNLPAILVTGFGDERVLIEAIRAGVRDFVPKTERHLDDLPAAVERVMSHVVVEKRLAESEALRESQEQLKLAFEAARLASWSWDPQANAVQLSGVLAERCGLTGESSTIPFEDFIKCIHADDKSVIKSALTQTREEGRPFNQEFRLNAEAGEDIWVLMRGSLFRNESGGGRILGVASDITPRKKSELLLADSLKQIQALNERLQLGMTETHHRVKNSLQILGSLLSFQLRDEKELGTEDIRRLIAHIHGFASLHDLLTIQARDDGETSSVNLKDILERLITVFEEGASGHQFKVDLANCQVTPRHGSTLAVIFNELISNALKHGDGAIQIKYSNVDGRGRLTVANVLKDPSLTPEFKGGTGVKLIRNLCRADFKVDPEFVCDGKNVSVTLSFPLEVKSV